MTKKTKSIIDFYVALLPNGQHDITYVPVEWTKRKIINRFLKRNPEWKKEKDVIIAKIINYEKD